jgi:superoxide reductase
MTDEPLIYRCPECGEIIIANSVRHNHKYPDKCPEVFCCGKTHSPLDVCSEQIILDSHQMKFVIFGGYERNSVRIEVEGGFHPMDEDHRIEWIYMRTFQGGQLKILPPGSRSFANFSFADNDAFVYCDRDICKLGREHCQFSCKRGMIAYAFCSRHSLFQMALEG